MITLPAGFDYSSLVSDFFKCVLPFIAVIILFVSYRVITKIIGRV